MRKYKVFKDKFFIKKKLIRSGSPPPNHIGDCPATYNNNKQQRNEMQCLKSNLLLQLYNRLLGWSYIFIHLRIYYFGTYVGTCFRYLTLWCNRLTVTHKMHKVVIIITFFNHRNCSKWSKGWACISTGKNSSL